MTNLRLQLLLQHLKEHKIPSPEIEYTFAPGRKWRFDMAWPGGKLAVEIEGGMWIGGRHTRPSGYLKDLEKYNRAAILGWKLLRVTYDQIEDGSAADLIRQAWWGDQP